MPLNLDKTVLHPDIQQFIVSNTGKDSNALALSKNPCPEADWKEILNQIAARTKASTKLPTWFDAPNIIWPAKVSVEQTSSEITAVYKSNLVSGKSLIDLTGGFGVDDYYFAQKMQSVVHCEINTELSSIAAHNFKQLQVANIECMAGDGMAILQQSPMPFDWIYIDPSRRHDAKGKVFLLSDCMPDVPKYLNTMFSFADNILIKVSPLLDITAGLSELKNVKAIHIVAVKNEVKELLWLLEKNYSGTIAIKTVDLAHNGRYHFDFVLEAQPDASYSVPMDYLYEPNAAIMKSGGFDAVSGQYGIGKLHRHSHLYTSDTLIADFPGRTFKIDAVLPYNKNELKKLGSKANVTVRNFPETVESLRRKWKITDGGDAYYFFTTNIMNEKIVLLCAKIVEK
jgi:hypothetical protein